MATYILIFLSICMTGVNAVCEDLSTPACSLFLSSKPDLCQDPTLSANCKRFCGLCPLECYSCATPVNSPDDCNTTTTCGQGEVCMKKTHSNPDGSKEFILSCETKTICDGFGFAIGKRNMAAADRSRRDISFHCCDVDLCNYPDEFTTTTTMPTTTTTTFQTTTLKPLNNCSRDLVFMLDGSTTIGASNHYFMKQFVHEIVSHLNIGPIDSQVAMIEYSDIARVEWYLTDHMTSRDLQTAISQIPYVTGNTSTHAAFYLAHNSVLTPRHGDRPNAKDVIIVLTDGGTMIPDLAISEAIHLHNDGVQIIPVGVGSNINQKEFQQYVHVGSYYTVSQYQALHALVDTIVKDLCK
ncbi:Collagen type VI alpha 3 [Mactra antiquata]